MPQVYLQSTPQLVITPLVASWKPRGPPCAFIDCIDVLWHGSRIRSLSQNCIRTSALLATRAANVAITSTQSSRYETSRINNYQPKIYRYAYDIALWKIHCSTHYDNVSNSTCDVVNPITLSSYLKALKTATRNEHEQLRLHMLACAMIHLRNAVSYFIAGKYKKYRS